MVNADSDEPAPPVAQLDTLENVKVEREALGPETVFRILSADGSGENPTALFARVQALVDGQSDVIIGLALEAGRLDDVFRDLTRGAESEAAQ